MSNADRPAAYQEQTRQNGSNLVTCGEIDERGLVLDQFREKAMGHAYRMLSGALVIHDTYNDGHWTIRMQGQHYKLSEEQFQKVRALRDIVSREVCDEEGRVAPFSVEDQIAIFDRIRKRANIEFEIPPQKLRVMFIRMDQGGCGFYRIIQPVRWLQRMASADSLIHCEETNFVSYPMLCNVDIVVVPRQCSYQTLSVIQALKRVGKIIVYETDDLLANIPDWNAARTIYNESDLVQRRQMIMDLADNFIVSTPELRNNLTLNEMEREKILVVYNGIDHRLWPMVVRDNEDQRVNILWAGSDTHAKDLSLIHKVIKRLMSEFKGKIAFTFIGYMPEEFSVTERRGHEIGKFVKKEYEREMQFIEGCPVQNWPGHLDAARPDICIAPLVDHTFNRCKSELKVIEAWALGCPIVASDIEPYRRAIEHGTNGYLAKDEESWHTHLRNLILNKAERHRVGGNGVGTLKQKYVMERLVYQMESALLKIAKDKVQRPECRTAILKRIEDLEYEGNFGTGDVNG